MWVNSETGKAVDTIEQAKRLTKIALKGDGSQTLDWVRFTESGIAVKRFLIDGMGRALPPFMVKS